MPRTLNFTGRKKIFRDDIDLRLVSAGKELSFRAQLRLSSYKFPDDAHVYVEAYRGTSTLWKRFDFGRVATCSAPEDCSLDEFETPDGIRFRIKVTAGGENSGRLLGHADSVLPLLPDQEKRPPLPLIDVDRGPLKGAPWKVAFHENNCDLPTLVINDQIDDWHGWARNSQFRSLVMPAVMREILTRILTIEDEVDEEDDSEDWRKRWLEFAEQLPHMGPPPGNLSQNDSDERLDEIMDWIDDAVSAFGMRSGLTQQLIQQWNSEGQP